METLKPLTSIQIIDCLKTLHGWSFEDDKIQKKFVFKNFAEAIGFIIKVAAVAEKNNHHPEIYNVYNRVELKLTTHDAGNKVTTLDIKVAMEIEAHKLFNE